MATSVLAAFKLPFTLIERLEMGEEKFSVPATFKEYLAFADKCDYKVEYSNGKITTMGSPTDTHELICLNIGWILNSFFEDQENYRAYGSNLGLLLEETGAHYRPDTTLLNSPPVHVTHKIGKRMFKSVNNPYAVFEVFSNGTMKYDMDEKLPNYKQSKHLNFIIYINQHRPFVTVWKRTKTPGEWLTKDYNGLGASFELDGKKVELNKLYKKVIFLGNGKKKSEKKKA